MCDIALSINIPKNIVFATGDSKENLISKPLIKSKDINFFVGSENHVLKRFIDAITQYPAKYIIRITCDNYLVQPNLVEELYQAVIKENADYGYIKPLSHYCGEIIKSEVLLEQFKNEKDSLAREHVTWSIRASDKYKIVAFDENYRGINHGGSPTLDTVDDFVKMKLLEKAYPDLKNIRCLNAVKKIA